MAMNIKDAEAEQLAAEVAALTGESKTAAVRHALRSTRDHLVAVENAQQRADRFMRFLEEEVWPQTPPELRGERTTKAEREEILGYGPEGV